MSKLFFIPFLFLFTLVNAQTNPSTQTQLFGTIDTADLKITACDFEKDTNAMVLFDKAEVVTGFTSTTVLRHKRIKIFNDKSKDEANISLEYYSFHNLEDIFDVEAETINLDKNVIKFTKVEQSLIYKQTIDKAHKKVTFTFPGVKAGTVIEYSYKLKIGADGGFPDWYFQEDIPVRYSELKASIRNDYSYKIIPRIYKNYEINTKEFWINGADKVIGDKYVWAIKNIGSFKDEPYSTSPEDNIQRIQFILTAIKLSVHGELRYIENSWREIGDELAYDPDFGGQLNEKLNDDSLIIQAKLLKTDNEKISYVFDRIKNSIKWNGINCWYTIDGIKKAWDKKTGNSTEINLILYCFLKQTGLKCSLETVSTRGHGKVDENYHEVSQFNKTVVVIMVNDKRYILDASDKYNTYADIPFDILNSSGLLIDPDNHTYILSYVKNDNPSRQVVSVNAQIEPGGELEGTAQINNFGYNRIKSLNLYNVLGESKYTNLLKNDDNALKIYTFKRENTEIDTLPLTDNIAFKLDLMGSDETYIYVNPNLFTSFYANPFLSESRNSTIDFGCINNYVIYGRYKIPAGYKIEALPKSLLLVMPDKSITFKRIVAEQDGDVLVHYVIDYKRSIFTVEEYPSIHDFYKKIYEMLNEQIVLKKS